MATNQPSFELYENRPIGQGQHGSVYHCKWRNLPAAVKLYRTAKTSVISQEIDIIKESKNQNIILYYGDVVYKDAIGIIVEYSKKGSLRHQLDEKKLPSDKTVDIISGIIDGMVYLHSSGIVHADLKSPNVLLDKNYEPKICDFGLQTLKQSVAQTAPKNTEAVRWMAPELITKNATHTYASDIYALGTIIWEILTKKIPYEQYKDYKAIAEAIVKGEREAIPDGIEVRYNSMITACWHSDPNKRATVLQLKKMNDASNSGDGIDTGNAGTTFSDQPKPDYATFVEAYLMDQHRELSNSEYLVSLLERHGEGIITWIQSTAAEGNVMSLTVLGEMCLHGCQMEKNETTAHHHFNNAAQQGFAVAQYNLGYMYDKGRGVKANDQQAFQCYLKAAKQDYAAAQRIIGVMYQKGRGVQKSEADAVTWFTKAANQGMVSVQTHLGNMYWMGHGVEQSDNKAVEWYIKAAEQGDAAAQYSLGYAYQTGRGVALDMRKAKEWYGISAAQGNVAAQCMLASEPSPVEPKRPSWFSRIINSLKKSNR